MKLCFHIRNLILFIALFVNCHAGDKTPDFVIEALPSWVDLVNEEEIASVVNQKTTSGVHYRLLDFQIKKEKDAVWYFSHISKQVVTTNGVDNAAQIEVEFDPLCESIAIHHIQIRRGNTIIDQLHTAHIKVLQRERSLENQVYSGKKSIHIILDDIRIGDVIDYSYSIKDTDESINKSFYKRIFLSETDLIDYLNTRILWPIDRPLRIQNHGTTLKPQIKQQQDYTEYLWRIPNIPLTENEPYTPTWYDDAPWIEVAEKMDWHEVNLHLSPRYQVPQSISPAIKELVDSILSQTKDAAEQFISIMRFVQDEIRYMHLGDRIDGHKPMDVDLVFSKRLGDCKDKTFLSLTLLKALGIEAYAALVNTVNGHNLDTQLPHLRSFNHAIVVAIIDGKKYWIDPTQVLQGGTLNDFVQPDEGYALILDGHSTNLTKMTPPQLIEPTIEVHEIHDVSKGPEKPSSLKIKTILRATNANTYRGNLQTMTEKEIQDSCIDLYRKYYPSLSIINEPKISDDRWNNVITITEEYEIPDQWQRDEVNKKWFIETHTGEFDSYLSQENISADRKSPVAILFPRHVVKKIDLILPDKKWRFNFDDIKIKDPAFEYKRKEEFKGSTYSISYSYKSLSPHVESSQIGTYLENIKNVLEHMKITFQDFDEIPTEDDQPNLKDKDTLNWPILILMVITLAFSLYAAIKIYGYKPEIPVKTPEGPIGIQGWLLIPAISIILTPFSSLWAMRDLATNLLSHNIWVALSSPNLENYTPFQAPLCLLLLLMCIFLWVIDSLILVLFIQEKRIFPRLYIYGSIGSMVIMAFDHIINAVVLSQSLSLKEQLSLYKLGIMTLIWCIYMTKSKRVRATFVK